MFFFSDSQGSWSSAVQGPCDCFLESVICLKNELDNLQMAMTSSPLGFESAIKLTINCGACSDFLLASSMHVTNTSQFREKRSFFPVKIEKLQTESLIALRRVREFIVPSVRKTISEVASWCLSARRHNSSVNVSYVALAF